MSGASTARLADLARALRPQPAAQASLQTEEAQLLDAETVTSPFHDVPLFKADTIKLTDEQKAQMDTDGHLVLPGFLTDDAVDRLIASMSKIQTISSTIDQTSEGHRARAALQATFMGHLKANEDASEEVLSAKREEFQGEMEKLREQYPELRKMGVGATAMEYDEYLESCVGHPQMLSLAREVLGYDIRFDHMVALNRPGGNAPMGYHTHEYADNGSTFEDDEKFPKVGSLGPELSPDTRVPDDPSLGFIRIFFYVTGFEKTGGPDETKPDGGGNGNLKVVKGSHLFRDPSANAPNDEALEDGWMKDPVTGKTKLHPLTGEPLEIEELECPRGSVVLMWTHALHGVNGRSALSPTRWCVVTAYRNPGAPSHSRWINDEWEVKAVPGLVDPALGPKGLKDHTY